MTTKVSGRSGHQVWTREGMEGRLGEENAESRQKGSKQKFHREKFTEKWKYHQPYKNYGLLVLIRNTQSYKKPSDK